MSFSQSTCCVGSASWKSLGRMLRKARFVFALNSSTFGQFFRLAGEYGVNVKVPDRCCDCTYCDDTHYRRRNAQGFKCVEVRTKRL